MQHIRAKVAAKYVPRRPFPSAVICVDIMYSPPPTDAMLGGIVDPRRGKSLRTWYATSTNMTISLRCRYTKHLAAGNRWHIDCFRCNTCGTLLDSDANLLLLGDGSLICNNCTYSCSACGNKIEDLAILTGDQAFCASCFRCRNCKKKIENLKYARTSQGIFCMDCHESLMQRRRKKTARHGSSRYKQTLQQQSSSNTMLLHKSLPSLPPNEPTAQNAISPENESPPSEGYSDTPTELPHMSHKRPSASRSHSHSGTPTEQSRAPPKRPPNSRSNSSRSGNREKVDTAAEEQRRGMSVALGIPVTE